MTEPTPQRIAVAVVEHQGRYLIRRRPEGAPLAGYWEFPGGKINPGESPEAAAERECREESRLEVRAIKLLAEVDHRYDHGLLKLYFSLCACKNPAAIPEGGFQWVEGRTLDTYSFPPANEAVVQRIVAGQSAD